MKHMDRKARWMVAMLSIPLCAQADVKVERSPLEIGTSIDVGQVVKGENLVASPSEDIKSMMIQRTGVYLNQATTVNDRLVIKVGVGGLFFYGYPEIRSGTGAAQSRSTRFGPGVGQAQGLYKFGNVENPSMQVQFGYFPFKYNPDAKNLGEYLFRSGTYPGYEITGGYSIINSAGYMASGLRINGNALGGKLKADLNVFMERDVEPAYDFSPGLVVSYAPLSALEVGVGAAFAHLIPANPSKAKSRLTKYLGDTLASPGDTTRLPKTYTFQGTKLMARAALNLGSVLNNPFIGKEGLKLYTEVAVLGWKNYPYFYTNRMARTPFMVGLNLPTFNFFDMLSVELEYRKWDFPNSTKDVLEFAEPTWRIPTVDVRDSVTGRIIPYQDKHLYNPSLSQADAAVAAQLFIDNGGLGNAGTLVDPGQTIKPAGQGNIKWSVYVKKQMATGVNLYLQVASDHMRGIKFEDNTLDREVLTPKPTDWYYLFRLEFGI